MQKLKNKILEWKLYSKTNFYKKKVKIAIKNIQKAKDLNLKFSISWSGGKDSTAMTHLIKMVWPECPITSQIDDCDWPETLPYMKRLAEKYDWKIHFVKPDFKIWDVINKIDLTSDNFCSQNHWLTKEGFLKPLWNKYKELDCKGVFLGLRAEESGARKRNFLYRQFLYQKKNGQWTCIPIAMWNIRDVYGYLTANNIEINPCYFKNRFRQPEDIRLAWALPSAYGIGQGDLEHIKYYYPKYFEKLRKFLIV
ncbi:MAG: phosphoadenosine phosphosulfate reductase family protein [Promethearchaeota archaeon]